MTSARRHQPTTPLPDLAEICPVKLTFCCSCPVSTAARFSIEFRASTKLDSALQDHPHQHAGDVSTGERLTTFYMACGTPGCVKPTPAVRDQLYKVDW
jgi:hypothetical protein